MTTAQQDTQVEVVDLAETPRRELNARLHSLPPVGARPPGPLARHAPRRRARPRGRPRRPRRGRDRRARRLLLRRHEQAGDGPHPRQRRRGVPRTSCRGTSSWTATRASRRGRRDTAGCSSSHGDASARCGISMKGADIVVHGDVGHMTRSWRRRDGSSSAATRAMRSATRSMRRTSTCVAASGRWARTASRRSCAPHHVAELRELLERAEVTGADPAEFRRYGSARTLYNFSIDNAEAY